MTKETAPVAALVKAEPSTQKEDLERGELIWTGQVWSLTHFVCSHIFQWTLCHHLLAGVNKLAFPLIIIGEKLLKIRGKRRISAQGRVKNLLKEGQSLAGLICMNHGEVILP